MLFSRPTCPAAHAPVRAAVSWPRIVRAHRRGWLRLLLVAALFSAVHGLVGAWVVSALAPPGQALVEVCTPAGLQWVSLDATTDGGAPADWPQGLAQPCVWAVAQWAQLPSGVPLAGTVWATALASPGPLPRGDAPPHLPGGAERVLLMSPMRAPPG